MKRSPLLGLVGVIAFFLLAPFTFAADGCFVDADCTFWADNVPSSFDGVNITFYFPDESSSAEFQMSQVTSSIYAYTTQFSVLGNILGCMHAYNSTTTVTLCESKEIYKNTATEELDMLAEIFQPFLIFLVGMALVLLAYFGESRATYFFGIAGGIWWLGSSGAMFFTGALTSAIFFILIGFVTIFISIGELNKIRSED